MRRFDTKPRRAFRVAVLSMLAAWSAWTAAGAAESGTLRLVPDRIKADTVVILAHPDDEGVVAPVLARWALEDNQRVVNIYLTSGDSGTNRVGDVHGPAFGYMRLTELHWALDRLGVAMFHSLGRSDGSNPTDPGAVLDSWDRPRTIRELTRYLRILRPRQLLTWFPGPPSSHIDHIASGAAALLACRAAASPDGSPEQMQTEGLRPWSVPEILLFAQAEKVGYERYPDPPWEDLAGSSRIEEIPVTGYSEKLGRTWLDIAREAMREHRSVGVGMGQARGGPFDEPLKLIRVSGTPLPARGAPAPSPGPGADRGSRRDVAAEETPRLTIEISGSPAQVFLGKISAAVEAPFLPDLFPPEALLTPGHTTKIEVALRNGGRDPFKGSAKLKAPEGWRISPGSQALAIEPRSSATIAWSVEALEGDGPRLQSGEIVITAGRKNLEIQRAPIVLNRGRRRPAPPRPG